MSVQSKSSGLTAEEYLALPNDPGTRYELVRGELVEVGFANIMESLIGRAIYRSLDGVVERGGLGIVFGDGLGYVVARNPDTVRGPDVSFISAERMRSVGNRHFYIPFAPDLAVEIAPESNSAADLSDKVRDYLSGVSHLVWVVLPASRGVTAHAVDGRVRTLGPGELLDGGDVLPGLRVHVADLFVFDV